ncbi:DnaB-like helicase N-terminal domain-containing protein, partial [Stenotrophomonas maltophilia]
MNAVLADFPHDDLRQLPQSRDAEQSVLGALMLDPEGFPKVSE